MNKWFKYSLISLLAGILLFFSIAIYVYQNLDQFKGYALTEVNKQLNSEITTGRIDLNLFADFPRVSITFNQVAISDPIRKDSFLLKAKTLYLGFDFYDILREKFLLHSLYADSAQINIFINKEGMGNYEILKKQNTPETGASSFKFELNLLKLKNSDINFLQENLNQSYSLFFYETSLSGNFSDKEFQITSNADAWIHSINLSGLSIIQNKPLKFDLKFMANPSQGLYTISDAKLTLSKLNLAIKGNVQQSNTYTDYKLYFKGDKIKIQELISLLPFQLPKSVDELSSEGLVYFQGNYLGKDSKSSKPLLSLDFGVDKGTLSNPSKGIKLSDIYFKGKFLGASNNTSIGNLTINDLTAKLGEDKISGMLDINLSDQSELNARLNGSLNLAELQNLLKLSLIKKIEGNALFNLDLKVAQQNGIWNWVNPKNKIELTISGTEMLLTDFSKPFNNYNADVYLNNENIQISNLRINIGKSDLNGSGFLPGILSSENSKTLHVELKSHSFYLDAEDLMIYEPQSKSSNEESNVVFHLILNAKADNFKYQKLIGNALNAEVEIEPGILKIKELNLNAWGGSVQTTGVFDFSGKSYTFDANPVLQNVKIKQLLKEFDDFAQDAIKSEHIDGTLNCNSKIFMAWDEGFNFMKPKFKAVAELKMKNGQLINYEPLYAMSKFIDLNDLKNLKFSEMTNTFQIENEKLIIPEMDIKTNAISLSISGNHSFENYLDYHLKVTLSDLLNKRRNVKENEFGEESDVTGKTNLFLSIKGPANNLKFTYDKKAVRAKIAEEIKKEGANIKEIIKSEIGFKKDTTIKESKNKDGNNDELEFENE
jgi:hypothetical protein